MKNRLSILCLLTIPVFGFSQWSKTTVTNKQNVSEVHAHTNSNEIYTLNLNTLHAQLEKAPEKSLVTPGAMITIPNTNGNLEKFEVWEYSNMDPELQAKFPEIRSYVGRSTTDASAYLRFSFSPQGFSSMVIRSGISEYVEPYTTDGKNYIVFNSQEKYKDPDHPFQCEVFNENNVDNTIAVSKKTAGTNTFRFALSCTGEYSQYFLTKSGTPSTASDSEKKAVVLAAMNATVTRLNGVYERDLSLHYNLIAQTESLIFLDASTDPYPVGAGPNDANSGINSTLGGSANTLYDIGHLIDKKDANGAAGVGVICSNGSKARGWTSHNIPEGVTFDVDYVAHEMGHQMGAGHTYTMYTSQADQTVEPGSGSTIMSYAGIVGDLDVQYNAIDNYHYNSLNQIKNKINSISCGVNVPYSLPAPNLSAGNDYTIPKSTPFVLRAITTDTNTGSYTYAFDQSDMAATAQIGANSITYEAKPTGPNFKTIKPTSQPFRYFPDLNITLSGVKTTRWESLSNVARALNFGVTIRNNNPIEPNISRDAVKLTVSADAGPFAVTAPTFGQTAHSGDAFTVTWDVANTNAAPINTANVNIKLSTDGGVTFVSILDNTPNDGSEQITIPANSTASNAYIMIEAVNNVYFAVSPSFVIDYQVTGEDCSTYTYSGAPVNITDSPGGGGISSPKISVPLDVTRNGVVTKIKVTPNITHPRVTQLSFGIESPAGVAAVLMHHQCGNIANITGTFSEDGSTVACTSPVSGNIKPFESISIFKGTNAQGTWKLFASDNNPNYSGSIGAWSLEVCTRGEEALGVKNTALANDIKIYPNPTSGNFFIKSKDLDGKVEVTIFDASGKRVYSSSETQNKAQSTKEYNVNLPKGVYIVNVRSSKGVYSQKLIVK